MNSNPIKKMAVFCGSSAGHSPKYREVTENFADVLSERGITLIYGGARVGIMGVLADRMLARKASVMGVMPKALFDVEIAHRGLTEFHIVNSMHERKAFIAEQADGFVMLPGGAGSLDEFFEIFTWAQLGYHSKPCGILNIDNYYNDLLKFLDYTVSEGFIKNIHRNMIIVEQAPDTLMNRMMNYSAPVEKKWMSKEECECTS